MHEETVSHLCCEMRGFFTQVYNLEHNNLLKHIYIQLSSTRPRWHVCGTQENQYIYVL